MLTVEDQAVNLCWFLTVCREKIFLPVRGLRATVYDNPGDWPGKLPAIMAAYRMTPHSTTGITPTYAMLGREVRLPCLLIAAPPEETPNLVPYNIHFRDNMRAARERVRSATNRSSKIQNSYFDARVRAVSLTKGQLVWLYWPCLLYTSPSPRDGLLSRMPSSA